MATKIKKLFARKGKAAKLDGPATDSEDATAGPSSSTPTPVVTPEVSKQRREVYGLFNLYVPPKAEPCVIDIVAVHGLGSDWEDAWTEKVGTEKRLWLRDFLPAKFPNVRVMSYGYDAAFALSSSVSDIETAATSLLDYLNGARLSTEEKERPIIFVAHSLGGIVVKKAIILAYQRSDYYLNIVNSAKGIIFFGVPHRGADLAYWAKFATNIISYASLGAVGNSRFVKALERNSPEFAAISRAFIQPASRFQHIRSFYESVKIGNQIIVDQDSATLLLNNELPVQIQGADHRNICKFTSAESQKYKPVQNALQHIIDGIETSADATIHVIGRADVNIKVSASFAKGCHRRASNQWHAAIQGESISEGELMWILHMDHYRSWLGDSGHRLLYVEYDQPFTWQMSLASTFAKDLRVRGVELIWFIDDHSCHITDPESDDTSFRNSGKDTDLRSLLPRNLVGQIFAKDPECLSTLEKMQEKMQERPVDSWQKRKFFSNGKVIPWKWYLRSKDAAWPHMWSLLSCVLGSLAKEYVVMLVGFDEDAKTALQDGLKYLLPLFSSGLYSSSHNDLSKARQRFLIVSAPTDVRITQFQELSARIDEETEVQACLVSLYFSELHARRDRVEKSERGTNKWIWTHPVYTRWQESKSNLLWIYGKPGSGKSTLAATIVRSLYNPQQGLDYVVADFFYSSRGGSTETSHTLMLRSILYQLLQQRPSLYAMFQSTFRRLRVKYSEEILWTYTDLRQILISLASNEEGIHFLLIVDGLDESEWKAPDGPERQKVLSTFTILTSTEYKGVFRVIALSRTEPDIRKALKTDYTIDMKNVNEADIFTIVRAGMAKLWLHISSEVESNDTILSTFPHSNTFDDSDDSVHVTRPRTMSRRASRVMEVDVDDENTSMTDEFPDVPELDTVRNHILKRADGVILWVVMIIRGLIKVAQSGTCTLGQLNESLQRIPNSLNDLYCDIVSKITDSPFKDERLSHYIFSWSCFAGRTLRVNEMRDVAAMFYWKPHSCQAFEVFLETNRVGALTKSWDPLRTLLLNLCGGLIEIVSSGSEPLSNALDSFSQKRRLSPYDEVQLIHTTAKEFLLDSKSPFLDLDKSKSLALISDTCIEYLTMSFLQNEPPILEQHETLSGNSAGPLIDLMDDRPMLAYALEWLPAHLQDEGWEQSSRVAACSKLIAFFQLTEFKIESSPIWDILGLWFFFNFITNDRIGTIPGVEDLRAGFSSKILNIASAQALFREIPPRVPSLVIPLFGIRYYKDDSNDRPNYPFTDSPGDQRLLSSYNFLNASLDYACKEGSLDQVLIILDLCLNAGIDRDNGDTPLCRAVKGGHYLVVRLLIERGADVNKSGPMGDTPLCIAALEGHHLVAQLLIEGGADVNKSGPMGDTPLCIAAFEGHHLVVRLLMERGANVNWSRGPTAHSCAGGDTPLNYAVLKGHTRVVKEILKVPGVDYAAPNCDLLTPLTTAFLLGKDHPIRTLLRDYAAVNPSKESTWGWLS